MIEVNEDSQLNITCTSPNAKPAPKLLWYEIVILFDRVKHVNSDKIVEKEDVVNSHF